MIKNPFSILRYTAILMLVASLFVVSGCNDDDGDAKPTMTLSELLASDTYKQSASVTADVALDSANKYFNLYDELKTMMTGTTPNTLFAPSNAAFVSLTAIPGLSNLKAVNPDIIKGVLLYHFVTTQKLKADLTVGSSIPTLYTETRFITTASPTLPSVQNITVNADGTLKTGSSNPSIVITTPDVMATNGVMHITGTALIPPSIGAVLVPILGTMAAPVLLGKDFTQLVKIIGAADAAFTETATAKKIVTYLAMPAANYPGGKGGTFFASPNAVLSDATVTAITSAPDKGRSFLLNHIVAGKYGVDSGTDVTVMSTTGQTINTSFTQKPITVVKTSVSANTPTGVIVTTGAPADQTKYAPIFKKDLANSNGLIQVIGGVLQ